MAGQTSRGRIEFGRPAKPFRARFRLSSVPRIRPDLDLALFPEVGRFPRRKDPDRAATAIAKFFTRMG